MSPPEFDQKSTCSEEFEHVVVLSVDITTNSDGTGNRLNIGLLKKDLFGHFTDNPQISFMETLGV